MKRTSETSLMAGAGLLIALLIFNAGLAWRNTRQLNEDAGWVVHTHEVLGITQALQLELVDAETGQRGFIITGDDEFLQPYDKARPLLESLQARLNGETSDNPEQRARVTQLDEAVTARLDSLKHGIDLRRQSAAAATAFIASGQGNAEMEAVSEQIAGIDTSENELLKEREHRNSITYRVALISGLITAILGLLTVGVLAWALGRNLRARQRAATVLHEQRELLRTTLASIGDGVIATDTAGKVTFLNPIAQSLTGWSQGEAGGQPLETVFNIVNEKTRLLVENPVEKVLKQGLVVGLANHTVLIARDLSERAIDDSAAPIRDEQGKIVGVVLIFRDVTERKQLEDLERESQRRLRLVLDSVPQKIFTTTSKGEADYFNPYWTQFTGLPFEHLVAEGWTQSIHPEDREENVRLWKHAVATGEPLEVTHRFRRADGEYRWHLSRAVALKDGAAQVQMWVGANTEIHDQKQLANELRQAAADLSEADKRKNEFLAVLAHELRNPLAPIRNSAQVLRLNGEALQSASAMMERQIGQMVRLVDDLLDVSRISRGKIELRREPIELASAINAAVDTARPSFEKMDLQLTVTLPQQPLILNADPTRLTQIVGNLLSNACKFTDRGGHIWLTVQREGEQAAIRVRDTGVGIAPVHLPRVFGMFMQIDTSLARSQGGLGIGLALVKNLVEIHDGTVEVRSPGLGQGSEFTIRLPISTGSETTLQASAVGEPASISGRRILVVDDNRDSASSLQMLLQMTGNETQTAYDGVEALQAAAEFAPDVVLLDIGLPKLNGYEVARKIREQPWGRSMVLVALTGWGQDEDRQKSSEAGFDTHMVKPVDYAALTRFLAELPAASGKRVG